jgi:hypothetical protein
VVVLLILRIRNSSDLYLTFNQTCILKSNLKFMKNKVLSAIAICTVAVLSLAFINHTPSKPNRSVVHKTNNSTPVGGLAYEEK